MKVLSLVKSNLVESLVIGFIIGFVSLIVYNCIAIGTTCYFSV
jgi:hypothetical protein